MRRTVTKLAMNKANLMALSNQITEQLGEWATAPLALCSPLLLPPSGCRWLMPTPAAPPLQR